jgi:hypothetical protein
VIAFSEEDFKSYMKQSYDIGRRDATLTIAESLEATMAKGGVTFGEGVTAEDGFRMALLLVRNSLDALGLKDVKDL